VHGRAAGLGSMAVLVLGVVSGQQGWWRSAWRGPADIMSAIEARCAARASSWFTEIDGWLFSCLCGKEEEAQA